MKAFVVDTNVLVTANGRAVHASPACVLASTRHLEDLKRNGLLVIDDGWRIIREYQQQVSPSGQPGMGDAFLKWVLVNQANTARVERVALTPREDGDDGAEDFVEFPVDPALAGFDPADRKFVAAARASKHYPSVVNATDTDWWEYGEALQRNGVRIVFLCPELMAAGKSRGR